MFNLKITRCVSETFYSRASVLSVNRFRYDCVGQSHSKGRSFLHTSTGVVSSANFSTEVVCENVDLTDQTVQSAYPLLTMPIDAMQAAIEFSHSSVGFPWWVAIGGTALVLRGLIAFPLSVYQEKMFAKRELLAPELKAWEDALVHHWAVKCRKRGDTHEQYQKVLGVELTAKRKEMYKRDGCHPWKSTASIWVSLPLWVAYSITVRRMADSGALAGSISGLDQGGALWFVDLLQPDQYYLFPIIQSLAHLANLEIASHRRGNTGEMTTRQRAIKGLFRGSTIAMFYIATQLPAAVSLYWTASGVYRVCENLYLKQPYVRRRFNIPYTPDESETPVADIVNNAVAKFRRANNLDIDDKQSTPTPHSGTRKEDTPNPKR